MKRTPVKTIFAASVLGLAVSSASAVTTEVVGYTSTTLPGGAGSIFAPSFINANAFQGSITGTTPGAESVLSLAGLSASAYDAGEIFPAYYLEVLDDTNGADGLDTEGLVLDVVSNGTGSVTVVGDVSALGLQGDEQVAIRKHLTLGQLFDGATGLLQFTDVVSIYNGSGAGTLDSYVPDGAGGWLDLSDFVTVGTDAVIYPGTGIVLNNVQDVTIVASGTVKETPTQVPLYAGTVNLIGVMKPVSSFDLLSDGALDDALLQFTDVVTTYSVGTLQATQSAVSDGAGGLLDVADFVTPVDLVVDGTADAVVVNAAANSVYKATGTVIPQ
ncbi:hypothetical protein [Coraliomargarita akajimensis]|uniref:Uncharacterized protein n=1 Tax=Coraliomargarita akajimensis (strain DSM 45221 / IAM 15411 / JCM 23193 / KCTC 12865 / 04OKA010-24) TaxID=583355 RepID=D5EMZ5_CORAD|nr:hypothetical protein [Coraliomargarita akajimensis]ADE55385.1 hypothetical protein Caka_2369 [Coraliomargarita akajimensis DSM 45221]